MKKLCLVLPLAVVGCLAGCAAVMHVTNNFPPGRNEAGLGNRSTNDIYVYSDTGESGVQESSSFMVGGKVTKPGEEAQMPAQPVMIGPPNPEAEPKPAPGATPTHD